MSSRVLVGTAGHIDHGKSALVLALTGTDPDRLPEEKSRGITIDLGFAHAAWDGITFSFVDVPGHERFVRTMVAGAQGVDVALLCVASDDGVMPQTREHLAILRLLGLRHGILVRTKADLADAELGAVVDEELRALVRGSFLEKAPLVAVSAVTGQGIEELRKLLTAAAQATARRDPAARPARLFVDRVFTMKGFGPVVTGTLDGGRVAAEDRLTLLPSAREVRVRRVEVHGEERRAAEAGERTSLNLAGVDRSDLERGMALVAPGSLEPSSLLTAEVDLLPDLAGPLDDGIAVRLHLGTADVGARLHRAPVSGAPDADLFRPGERVVVQLTVAETVPARRGDRFVLRRPSPQETLGGGRVLDVARPRIRRRAALPADSAHLLATGTEHQVALLLLSEAGPAALSAASLAVRLGIPTATSAAHLDAFVKDGKALRIAPGLYAPAAATVEMAERLTALFAERKRSGAPSLFLPKKELLARLAAGLSDEVAEGWLATLAAARKVTVAGDQAGPPGAAATDVSEAAGGFASRIEEAYRAGGFEVPRSLDLAKALGTKPAVVDGLVGHLLKGGTLVRLSPDVVVHRDAVEEAIGKLVPWKGQTLSVGQFRDVLGLTRKTLIPLLEHLDQRKRTRRVGDARVVE